VSAQDAEEVRSDKRPHTARDRCVFGCCERLEAVESFRGVVQDAGGGVVLLWVYRDTDYYPEIGAHVEVRLIDAQASP
jgi:hypothetical protein